MVPQCYNIVSLSVHTILPAMLEALDPCGLEGLIPVPENYQPLSPPCLTGNAFQLGALSCSKTKHILTEIDPVNTEGDLDV